MSARESGTSSKRAEWARAGLVLVGHGSGRAGGGNTALRVHAAALRARRLFAEIHVAVLGGVPSPDQVLAGVRAAEVYVAPLFMSDGYFVRVAVPRAFGLSGTVSETGGRRVRLCPPLGLQEGLADLIQVRALSAAAAAGWSAGATDLLLIAHGSTKDPASRRATEAQADALRALGSFAAVRAAYLEEPPLLADALSALARPTVAIGLFAFAGRHAAEDAPRLIADHAGAPVSYLGAIGEDPEIANLILAQVRAAPASSSGH